jgi:hypothetical protein
MVFAQAGRYIPCVGQFPVSEREGGGLKRCMASFTLSMASSLHAIIMRYQVKIVKGFQVNFRGAIRV